VSYIDNVQTAASRFLNAILGGPFDQMLSARAYEQSMTNTRWEIVRAMLDTVFFWHPNHCRESYEWELTL
jgi:hypothetical protein